MKYAARIVLLLVLAAFIQVGIHAGEEKEAPLTAQTKPTVFAHYMTCFGLTVEFHKFEIEIARAHGLDGFAMDFGAYFGKYDKEKDEFEHGSYQKNLDAMFEAAKQVSPDFKLLLTPEYSVKPMHRAIEHMVKTYYKHPNIMRLGDKMVLSSYGPSGAWLQPALDKLKADGYEVIFIPFTGTGRHEMTVSYEKALQVLEEPWTDGMWRFICDSTPRSLMRQNATARRACLNRGKIYMSGIAFSYNSANVRDMQGLKGYGALWEGIARDRPDWVEIVTWNDYNEDTNLMHYKWKRLWDKLNYNRDGAVLDATSYFIRAYKDRTPPTVTQDRVYFAYRDRSRYLVEGYDVENDKMVDHTMKQYPFTQIHDDLLDRVYFSTFLTAPAKLTVNLAGKKKSFEMPAGLSHGEIPLEPGVPAFTLERGGKAIIDVVGRRRIIDKATEINSPLGYHRNSRVWAGAAAAGVEATLEAEKGELQNGAEIRDGKAVFIPTKAGAAVTVKLPAIETGMHNIRLRYSHANEEDARLMLFAPGMPFEDKLEKYCLPVWLPPTGEGEWATATVMWTLDKANATLRVECSRQEPLPADADEKTKKRYKPAKFGWNDRGDVLIDRIEIVRVEPFEAKPAPDPAMPELVMIPGGSFTMGGEGGEPDELPAREVTVSPFAIGKYEVTNRQFEQFWPGHRKWRDGFSWRDDEPVIYVSWMDAARYCDWLSVKHGLTPYYGLDPEDHKDKKVEINAEAAGFRLPTEAEWEYVATGRGENRKYPWGDEEPQPMAHGNFDGKEALEVPAFLRSNEAKGTVVVGSFPAGASRDGVMDMGGNVCEWCSDWYKYYPKEKQADPLQTASSHSRVMRGGSWGYYGYSQRAKDREFNSEKYPGYVYIGLRVALPEAGCKKLKVK